MARLAQDLAVGIGHTRSPIPYAMVLACRWRSLCRNRPRQCLANERVSGPHPNFEHHTNRQELEAREHLTSDPRRITFGFERITAVHIERACCTLSAQATGPEPASHLAAALFRPPVAIDWQTTHCLPFFLLYCALQGGKTYQAEQQQKR